MTERLRIIAGDALAMLKTLPDESVQMCVTSPPYWGLRDYGVAGQLGLERTPEEYIARMVEVFREVRRVLRSDGVMFLNVGDSYWGGGKYRGLNAENSLSEKQWSNRGARGVCQELGAAGKTTQWGLKPKDLCGIPWRLAFALQASGWWLRQDLIWHKPNPMPESVTDRCTKSHEYIFMLTKSARYYFDAEAIKEPSVDPDGPAARYGYDFSGRPEGATVCPGDKDGQRYAPKGVREFNGSRNKRSVWTVATAPYSEAHFATFPPDLIKPCILAGTSARGCCPKCGGPWERVVEIEDPNGRLGKGYHNHKDDLVVGQRGVFPADGAPTKKTTGWQPTCTCGEAETQPCVCLDPFFGSGTTGQVALELGRSCIGIELNPAYLKLAERRCHVTPGLALA